MKSDPVEKSGKSEGKKLGRPPEPVPQDIADAIIEWLEDGRTMTSYQEQHGGYPASATLTNWKDKDPIFAERFARARRASADALAERAQDVAFTATPEDVQVAKLQVDTLLKRAACFCPSVYGTKASVEHSGKVSLERLVLGSMKDEDADE